MQSMVRVLAHRNLYTQIHAVRQPFTMGATSYSSTTTQPSPDPSKPSIPSEQKKPLLALPETTHNASESGTTTLNVSNGNKVKLDHLGPMVVGVDGTLARISNWEGMTEREQKATLRIIGKRNQERLEALRATADEK